MVGDRYRIDGVEMEVVWDGAAREGLLPDRETKPTGFWEPPKRLYNKKSEYWVTRKRVDKVEPPNENPISEVTDDSEAQ